MTVERSIKEVIEMLKASLTPEELERMVKPPSRELDAYTSLINYFALKNMDAFVRCTSDLLNTLITSVY